MCCPLFSAHTEARGLLKGLTNGGRIATLDVGRKKILEGDGMKKSIFIMLLVLMMLTAVCAVADGRITDRTKTVHSAC